MSIEAIAALLGHKTLAVAIVYARIADKIVADEDFSVAEKVEALYDRPHQLRAESRPTRRSRAWSPTHRDSCPPLRRCRPASATADGMVKELLDSTGFKPDIGAMFHCTLVYTRYEWLTRHGMRAIMKQRPGCPPTPPTACTRAGTAIAQSGARQARLSMATTRLAAAAGAKIRSQTLPPMGAVWNASFITGR